MNYRLLLRIAFGCVLFHFIGHTIGMLTWEETEDPTKDKIISAMNGQQFEFMGAMKSIGENYRGMNLLFDITLLMLGVIILMLSQFKEEPGKVRSLLLVIAISFFGFSVTEFLYFFPLAAVTSLLAGFFTAFAAIKFKV